MIYNNLIIFLIFLFFITFIKGRDVTVITFDVLGDGMVFEYVGNFNEYAEKNNVDIKLNLISFTSANSTVGTDNGKVTIQSLLEGHSKKYDIYFYSLNDIHKFHNELLDLKKYISPETIKLYDNKIFRESCIINDRLVGFPLFRRPSAMYVDEKLLEKYDKPIPKTWEELLNTTLYIRGEEIKSGNTELLGLNGSFGDDGSGSNSIADILYSYRRSKESGYPDLKSQEAIDALEMYKKMYNSIITNGKKVGYGVFYKYYAYDIRSYAKYKKFHLPGWKEGISSSILSGSDIGISKHIDENQKKAAAQVLEFLLSKEEQRKMIINRKIFTGINNIYYENDEEVCAAVDCDFYRDLQLNLRYHNELYNYQDYHQSFRDYVYEFVHGNITAVEALDKINDLLYIHKITLDTTETSLGLIVFIFVIVLSLFFIGSMILINTPRFKPLFQFLPIDFWYVILLGILCHMYLIFIDYGEVRPFKCQLKIFLYSIGYTFTFIPLLYKLIANFPVANEKSKWISNNRYIFFLVFVFCDIVLFLINLGSSYDEKTINPNNGKKYQICKMNNHLAEDILYITIGYKSLVFLGIGILSFIEWNIKETQFDIHISVSTIYINILSVVMIFVFKYISFDNYVINYILNFLFVFIIVLSNYIFLIGIRIVVGLINKNNKEENILKFKYDTSNTSSQINTVSTTSSNSGKRGVKALISYHYQTSISQ